MRARVQLQSIDAVLHLSYHLARSYDGLGTMQLRIHVISRIRFNKTARHTLDKTVFEPGIAKAPVAYHRLWVKLFAPSTSFHYVTLGNPGIDRYLI